MRYNLFKPTLLALLYVAFLSSCSLLLPVEREAEKVAEDVIEYSEKQVIIDIVRSEIFHILFYVLAFLACCGAAYYLWKKVKDRPAKPKWPTETTSESSSAGQ